MQRASDAELDDAVARKFPITEGVGKAMRRVCALSDSLSSS